MRSLLKTLAAIALVGASIACAVASSAFAAKPASQRHYAYHGGADLYGARARYASPIYHCRGGYHYTYLGGWGCDYYVYSESFAPRRR